MNRESIKLKGVTSYGNYFIWIRAISVRVVHEFLSDFWHNRGERVRNERKGLAWIYSNWFFIRPKKKMSHVCVSVTCTCICQLGDGGHPDFFLKKILIFFLSLLSPIHHCKRKKKLQLIVLLLQIIWSIAHENSELYWPQITTLMIDKLA